MSNYEQTKKELRDYILAGVPFVVVRSIERHRVERIMRELAAEDGLNVFYYTDAKQVQNLARGAAPSKDVESDPLPFANELFSKNRHTTFVVGDTKKLGQDSLYTRELLGGVYVARETKNTLIVVAAENVWPHLSRFGLFACLDFPDFDERVELVRTFVQDHAESVAWDLDDVMQVATLTRGLSEIQIVNLLRASLVSKRMLAREDLFDIASRKERLFTAVSNVVPVSNASNLEVAGLDALKQWLDRKKRVFFAPEETLAAYGLSAPKGVLLAGVPGCGKSFSAKMIASRWELPLFRFDIGSVYNKYVGETERQMQEALDYIDNVAPCVLWVDEIEKALSTSSGESDVGNRVLGQFLFWLQESKARVFLVATANSIEKLPPELFRKGRFSELFFIDLPNKQERKEAIRLYARGSLHEEFSNPDLDRLAEASDGFSYSDIEQSVKDLAEQMVFEETAAPDADALLEHFGKAVPIVQAHEGIEKIRAWGRERAQLASFGG